jgi:ribosomal protein S14
MTAIQAYEQTIRMEAERWQDAAAKAEGRGDCGAAGTAHAAFDTLNFLRVQFREMFVLPEEIRQGGAA